MEIVIPKQEHKQCGQIGRYLNDLGEMVLIKSGPNVRGIFGLK